MLGARTESSEVFGHSLDEVGRRHQDADGAEDGEDREGHEAQAVHHTGRELPLAAHGLALVLAAEAVGDVAYLLQNLGQVRVPLRGLAAVQQVLVVRGRAGHAAAHDPRVRGGRAVHAVQATEADVQQVAVGSRGPRHGAHLHAGQAAAALLVLAGRPHLVLPRSLHAQEPGTPVQEDDSRLQRQHTVRVAGKGARLIHPRGCCDTN